MITMDVEQLETEAKTTAAKHVANILQRPDQLEKVEQYKRRVSRKKASVEAMLKTAMQSQLDGVRSGLNQLQTALVDIHEIKQNLQSIEEHLQGIPALSEKLSSVREENIKHSQYAAAMENLKHIFTVPESVEKTQTWINDGKLLHAHKCLSDLENSRDDLLFELHKLPNQSVTDRNMLKHYFADVEKLSDMLSKQLWLVLKRTLNTVRQEPTVIVTVIRIIEREEKVDQGAIQQHKITGFLPPGRPKQWRQKAFLVLEEAVQERIEGNQFEDREDNPMWLVRHLEVTRILILEDLRVVKTLCVPCFPPHYDIVNRFVKMYHNCLSRHLLDICSRGLENNEDVTILTWLNTYEGPELLKHPELNIDINKVGPLLDNNTVDGLQQKYLKTMEQNYQAWMKKTSESEMQDWLRECEPESDGEGFYHTALPVIVFQMVDQNLQVTKTIGPDLVAKALQLSMVQVTYFGRLYRSATLAFKQRYFEDRTRIKYFTQYMVAIVNNCLHFVELSHQLKNRCWKPGMHDNDAAKRFETMVTTFQMLRDETAVLLLDEMFIDLEPHFHDLMTRKWLGSSTPMDTICITLEDYCQDYQHLRSKNFDYIMGKAQHRIVKGYVFSILTKRIVFRSFEERKEGAEKITKESEQLLSLMKRLAPAILKIDSPYDILVRFAEVLKVRDTEILSLELSGLVRKYPDMTQDHLSALLMLRGDLGRLELKQLVSEIIPDNKDAQKSGPIPKSLLSEIELPTSIF